MEHGVQPLDFNSYGSRRGNDRVMTRGTFANIRLKNLLAPGTEGGVTSYLPDRRSDAASTMRRMKYQADKRAADRAGRQGLRHGLQPRLGRQGRYLLGVKAVIAESFERIHRSNLVGMGVLPLVYKTGQTRASLGLTGEETFEIVIDDELQPLQDVIVHKLAVKRFTCTCRIDTPVEMEYYRNGGILHTVLRKILKVG